MEETKDKRKEAIKLAAGIVVGAGVGLLATVILAKSKSVKTAPELGWTLVGVSRQQLQLMVDDPTTVVSFPDVKVDVTTREHLTV